MKIIDLPLYGQIGFPEDMSDQEILNVIEKEAKKAKIKNDQVEKTTADCMLQAAQIAKDKEDAQRDL